jgi:methionyl-tRNA formyltransferase
MERLKIIFAGSGEFGLPTLRAILEAQHQIVRVYSQPDRPAGRGRKLAPTPIARFSLERNIELIRTEDINHESMLQVDLLVVIAFGQKIPPHIVSAPRLGAVNLHASLLPKYRGAAPINWAILKGDSVTGNSVIRLAQKMDAGAILGQSSVKIGELETAGELHDRLAADGAELTLRVIEQLQAGVAQETVQDETAATSAPKLNRESGRLDFSRPAVQLARRIRGLYPWPGCRVRVIDAQGKECGRVTLARARAAGGGGAPGDILPSGLVGAGDATNLEIVELQPEGGRAMSLQAYRNGHAWEPGMRLESI